MSRRGRPLLLALGLALAAAAGTAAPATVPPTAPPSPTAQEPPPGRSAVLVPLPEPVYEGVEAAVVEQLRTLRGEVDEALAKPSPPGPELAAQLGDLGGLYYFYGFSALAEAALTDARALTPGDFRWPYLLALVDERDGDLERAATGYEAALALRPNYVPALYHLGDVRLAQHRLDDADALFDRALAVDAACAVARFGLGRTAAERGDAAAAARQFEAVLDLQPQASRVHYPLAQAYRQLGRLDDAKAQLAVVGTGELSLPDPVVLAVRRLATGSSVHFFRGRQALRQDDYAGAVAELEQAEQADPENVPVLRALALALHKSGDLAGAVARYRKAVRIEPANPLNHQDLALALLDAGASLEAVDSFQRAIELDPAFAEAHLGLGIALGRLGRSDDALAHLDRSLELDPTSVAARFERAMDLLRLRRWDEAIAGLQAVIAADPGHAAARVNLAALLEERGDDEGAGRQAAAALDLAPPGPLAARSRLILGRIEERRGAPAKALEQYAAAAALDPTLPPARLRLASVQAATGDLAAAAESYRAVLAPRPRPAAGASGPGVGADPNRPLRRGPRPAVRGAGGGVPRGRRRRRGGGSGGDPALGRALALLLAGCPDPAVRDPARGLEVARARLRRRPGRRDRPGARPGLCRQPRFEEAVRAQGRLVAALEQAGDVEQLPAARRRLALFQGGRPALAPWDDDPGLLDPVVLPLPPNGGGGAENRP